MKTLLDPQADNLRRINTFPALVKYLEEELGWPVNVEDWDDAVYDWEPEELNLRPEHQVAIRSIKQLRPLVSNQPWGIFFVDFEKGQLPIVVLRRVLNGLAVKRRVRGSGHQTWMAHDLLFISCFGKATTREIALAHFSDESEAGDLPTLRVLGWDEDDTTLEIGYVAKTLKEKLRWPASAESKTEQEAWRRQWASAFSLKYRQVINDSKSLALALAELAKRIRVRVNSVLALETEHGHLRQLHKAFKDNLLTDLSEDGFADMYAQTITYGLFATRASQGNEALVADDVALLAPSTNPFLRDLLQDFLEAGGRARRRNRRLDFDELGINEVIATLRDVPMDAVLRAFNRDKPGDDPVIHFYEDFLKAYDKKMRAKRGVFYTPTPVVQFIVRSVDEALKTEFGIEDGLASTVSWGEMQKRNPALIIPKHCNKNTPFVQILDPATGTGTFIVEVITQVHGHMLKKWEKQGLSAKAQWQPLWNDYVRDHLLPRLHAFELMMAPYAIAHMKIGIKLAETGYVFPENGPRLNVFLANALEPPHLVNPRLEFEAPMLAHEASAANFVKERLMATVVIGNPPYSGISNNMFSWIDGLLKGHPQEGIPVKNYYQVDGQSLGEKKVWLQDDYVKFIRLGHYRIELTGLGVLGYITNHSYIESPTHRGMRNALLQTFPKIDIYNLHGSVSIEEGAPSGVKDQNVFDIEQGVAIGIFRNTGAINTDIQVTHTSFWGSREEKLQQLVVSSTKQATEVADCLSPNYYFRGKNSERSQEYDLGVPLNIIMPLSSVGVQTSRDDLAVGFSHEDLKNKIMRFSDVKRSDEEIRFEFFGPPSANSKYLSGDTRGWSLPDARIKLRKTQWEKNIRDIHYRPFDFRKYVASDILVDWPRTETSDLMTGADSVGLICIRRSENKRPYDYVSVSRHPVSNHQVSLKDGSYLFPLWRNNGAKRLPNISPAYLNILKQILTTDENGESSIKAGEAQLAHMVLHYIYSVLHSPSYRERYADLLIKGFPRIPLPSSANVFYTLANLGEKLTGLHLLEALEIMETTSTSSKAINAVSWFGDDFAVDKVGERNKSLAELDHGKGKVYVNSTSGFENVQSKVWKHTVGGYQVLHKWLDDRRKAGRTLSTEDIKYWIRVYMALDATQSLVIEVDNAIESLGGWTCAFSKNAPVLDNAILAAEQMAQKSQLKALKKLAKESNKDSSKNFSLSLFDPGEDLDSMTKVEGASPRPKASATPAKAAGGKDRIVSLNPADIDDMRIMCAIRAVSGKAGALERPQLIRLLARELGFARTGPRIFTSLDEAIRRAVRRKILRNDKGKLGMATISIEDYEREFLKKHLMATVPRTWAEEMQVRQQFVRTLGFARMGNVIGATVQSLVRSLIRSGDIERSHNLIRRIPTS